MNDDADFRRIIRGLLVVLTRPGTYAYFAHGFERPGVPPLLALLVLLNEDALEENRGALVARLRDWAADWEQGE